jgi:hypothetical protein
MYLFIFIYTNYSMFFAFINPMAQQPIEGQGLPTNC